MVKIKLKKLKIYGSSVIGTFVQLVIKGWRELFVLKDEECPHKNLEKLMKRFMLIDVQLLPYYGPHYAHNDSAREDRLPKLNAFVYLMSFSWTIVQSFASILFYMANYNCEICRSIGGDWYSQAN